MENKIKCSSCSKEIVGKRKKYCSTKCKNAFHKANNYFAQQKRGVQRKNELIKLAGGKCVNCGYCKNTAALSFHHINPLQKSFPLDLRHLSNRSPKKIKEEYEKCKLLCLNCHAEFHNPDYTLS